jgi:hypothetical protein
MLDEIETAEEMGRRGRAFIEATLSWHAIVGTWLDDLIGRLSLAAVTS